MEIRLNVVPFGVFVTPRRGEGEARCLTCGRVMEKGDFWAEAWSEEYLVGYVCQDCPELQERDWKEAMQDYARKRQAREDLLDRLLGETEFAGVETVDEIAVEPSLRCAIEKTLFSRLAADTLLQPVRVAD